MDSSLKDLCARMKGYSEPFKVTKGKDFRLKDCDPGYTLDFDSEDKPKAREALVSGVQALAELQERLYAQDRWSVLIVIQAMDAAGKDSAIKHVLSGVNPQGCEVSSFKAPSQEELDHDYLWRCARRLPERGRIGIFNRSYYEEALIVRVHPEILRNEKLPPSLITKDIWEERFEDMRNFERYLARNGTIVRKFFLHVSRDEQRRRFLERINDRRKNWKFEAGDVRERQHWSEYMDAYEDVIRNTATKHAPWYVVPADNKWFTRLVIAAAIVDSLAELDLEFPEATGEQRQSLDASRAALMSE